MESQFATQFGIANVWTQGDIVTKGVAILLLAMSLASWMVIIASGALKRQLAKTKRLACGAWFVRMDKKWAEMTTSNFKRCYKISNSLPNDLLFYHHFFYQ